MQNSTKHKYHILKALPLNLLLLLSLRSLSIRINKQLVYREYNKSFKSETLSYFTVYINQNTTDRQGIYKPYTIKQLQACIGNHCTWRGREQTSLLNVILVFLSSFELRLPAMGQCDWEVYTFYDAMTMERMVACLMHPKLQDKRIV